MLLLLSSISCTITLTSEVLNTEEPGKMDTTVAISLNWVTGLSKYPLVIASTFNTVIKLTSVDNKLLSFFQLLNTTMDKTIKIEQHTHKCKNHFKMISYC